MWEGEFIEKEGKWFNYIIGREEKWVNSIVDNDGTLSFGETDSNRIDTKELATQGIGFPSSARYIDTGSDSHTITTGTFTKIGK